MAGRRAFFSTLEYNFYGVIDRCLVNTCKEHLAIETRPNFRMLLLFSDGKIEQKSLFVSYNPYFVYVN